MAKSMKVLAGDHGSNDRELLSDGVVAWRGESMLGDKRVVTICLATEAADEAPDREDMMRHAMQKQIEKEGLC